MELKETKLFFLAVLILCLGVMLIAGFYALKELNSARVFCTSLNGTFTYELFGAHDPFKCDGETIVRYSLTRPYGEPEVSWVYLKDIDELVNKTFNITIP